MNLLITSSIDTNTGTTVTNAIGFITAHTDELLNTGLIPCDLAFYINMQASDDNKDKFIPVTLNQNNTINTRIGSITISLTQQQIEAANLPLTIFNKVASDLNTAYGWTVSVQQ